MPWRIAAIMLIILAGFNLSQAQAASQPSFDLGSSRQAGFENDNNLVDTLFQNFNGNESDDGGHRKKATVGPLPKPVSAPATASSAKEAEARARAGRETTIFLVNDRVVVRVPAALPTDMEVAIRIVETATGAPPPGPVIGGLLFQISAQPIGGDPLTRLPIEVNLSARYTDAELGTRDEGRLVLSWFDPADNQWKPAPKPAADPRNNYMSATIQALGLYAVHQAP